jgi:hyperosmotically inducible periplasmic protein
MDYCARAIGKSHSVLTLTVKEESLGMEGHMSKQQVSKGLALSAFVVMMALSPLAFGEGAGQYIDDAAITAKVKAALISDSRLKATEVKVETTQGSVQLTGMVNTKDQESEAVHTANKVDGVKSVEDLLTVRSTEQQ